MRTDDPLAELRVAFAVYGLPVDALLLAEGATGRRRAFSTWPGATPLSEEQDMAAHSHTSFKGEPSKDEPSDRTLDTIVRRRGSRYALWGAFAIAGLVGAFLIFQLL